MQEKKIPCEIYSRIVGYYRPTNSWNVGKKQEFEDRKYYDNFKKE
jgi:anaerobic ribonucleoside-triphosphate reductase